MIDVYFVVLPNTVLLDLAGPAEAFRIANKTVRQQTPQPNEDKFQMHFVGPNAELNSSVGLSLTNISELPKYFNDTSEETWVVLLGLPGEMSNKIMQETASLSTRNWLTKIVAPLLLAEGQQRFKLLTVCVGALIAADAGLLANRQCTSHHELLERLAQTAPSARVLSNRVFVEDGPITTSAGITAGIDLALHLIARHCGAAIASTVAQVMVAFTRRGPSDPSQSPLLKYRDHIHPAIHRLQDAVCAQPHFEWSSLNMAATACVTERHLLRLFNTHAGLSPREYVENVRIAIAQHALGKGASAAKAAEVSGLKSVRRLRDSLQKKTNSLAAK
jgi:transcriptional regulator GlxA family with amidase domain